MTDLLTALRNRPLRIGLLTLAIAALELLRRQSITQVAALIDKSDHSLITGTALLTIFSVVGYLIYAGLGLSLLSQNLLDSLLRVHRSWLQQCAYTARYLFRIMSAIIVAALIIGLPLLLSITTNALYFSSRHDDINLPPLSLLFIGGSISIIWAFFTSQRFVLIPFVAVFEPQIPLLNTPARSQQLLMFERKNSIAKVWAGATSIGVITLAVIANLDYFLANRIIIFVLYALIVLSICYLTTLYHRLRLITR
jgi:ABC-type multidrug transport system fused ATPase/permease subunit